MRTELYTINDCLPESCYEDYEGKIIVMHSEVLKEDYRKPQFQLWKATGGFGCDPTKIGRAVFGICLADGESARWDRSDFIGILKDELVQELNLEEVK